VVTALPLLLAVAGIAALGWRGWRRRRTAGPAEAPAIDAAARRGAVGLGVVLLALVSGLDGLAHASFTWHMVQHQLLLLVAAPLLASAAPLTTARAAIGRPARDAGGWLDADEMGVTVLVAGALALATLFVWHVPAAYDAALASRPIHHLEHLTLLGTATLAWGAILGVARDDRVLASVLVLAVMAISGAGLGVVLLTSGTPLYAYAAADPVAALTQQRLGGALMKVGALVVYAGAAVWLLLRWFERLERETAAGTPMTPARR
jgi:putative membrane protein